MKVAEVQAFDGKKDDEAGLYAVVGWSPEDIQRGFPMLSYDEAESWLRRHERALQDYLRLQLHVVVAYSYMLNWLPTDDEEEDNP